MSRRTTQTTALLDPASRQRREYLEREAERCLDSLEWGERLFHHLQADLRSRLYGPSQSLDLATICAVNQALVGCVSLLHRANIESVADRLREQFRTWEGRPNDN